MKKFMLFTTIFTTFICGLVYAEENGASNNASDFSQNKTSATTPAWLDKFTPKFELRYRYEMIDKETDKEARHRNRIKAILGLDFKANDYFNLTFSLGSGSSDDPVGTNQDLSSSFTKKPVWIEQAYLDFHIKLIDELEGLHFQAGKFKTPFITVGRNELIWDSDLRPEGMSLNYKHKFADMIEPFVNSRFFWIEERSAADDSYLLGAQGGLKFSLSETGIYFLAGAGYYDYTKTKGSKLFYASADKSFGNTADSVADPADATKTITVYKNDYNEIEAFAEAGITKLLPFPIAVYGAFVYNNGADEDNKGYIAGINIGKCEEPLSFEVRYNYRWVQKDALIGAFTSSDFAGGQTDAKGHEVGAALQAMKNVKLGINFLYNLIDLKKEVAYKRLMADLTVKF